VVIKLKRARDAASIHAGFTGTGLFTKLVALAQARATLGDAIEWEGILGDWKKMKAFLKRDSFDKCAYCEASTADVAHGDVEHFRPKSVYWWLALCVDNYVYSCQLCNQTYKGDKFPVFGTQLQEPRLPAVLPTSQRSLKRLVASLSPDPAKVDEAALLAQWLSEEANLPHPDLEDPEPLFAWVAVETNREVRIVAPDNASARSARAVDAATKYLGLNRETLARQRYFVYSALKMAVRAWKNGDPLGLDQIRLMCGSEHPFAGMCRYFAHLAGAPVVRQDAPP
jgi:hypothetical protein